MVRVIDQMLEAALKFFEIVIQTLSMTLLAIMLAINTVNITLRTFFNFSFAWVWPWTMVMFIWFVFLSLYLLYRQRRDVSVTLVHDRIGPVGQKFLGIFVHLVVAASSLVLILTVPGLIAKQSGYIEIVELPRYVLSIPFMLTSVLVFLDALHNILRQISGLAAFKPYGGLELE